MLLEIIETQINKIIIKIKPHRTCCKTHNECINAHKKSTTLEIIYSDQNQLPRVGYYHDFQFKQRTAWSYEIAEQAGILFISPINRRNSKERKDAYGRVLPVFLKTRFGQWLFGLRREIERVFNELKSDGVEQPRWYGFHRYLLHVLCCILMHNFEFLL
jgi:hypothetical protein